MTVLCPRAGKHKACKDCYHSTPHHRITGCYGGDDMKERRLRHLPCHSYCVAARKTMKCCKVK